MSQQKRELDSDGFRSYLSEQQRKDLHFRQSLYLNYRNQSYHPPIALQPMPVEMPLASTSQDFYEREIITRLPILLCNHSPVSMAFLGEVQQAVNDLPEKFINILVALRYKVKLYRFVVDRELNLRLKQPRGYDANSSYLNVGGFYSERQIILGEYRHDSEGEVIHCLKSVSDTVRHELAHGLDECWRGYYQPQGRFSATPEFRYAYLKDISDFNSIERHRYSYFLQGSDESYASPAGMSEAFAENMAILLGGNASKEKDFTEKFFNVQALLKSVFFD